jgi:hypothetical protein
MAAPAAQSATLEATFKIREAEGILDRFFYRRVGFQLAKWFAKLGFSPVGVTLLGGVFGITAGHFYFYRDIRINVVGMLLHVCANALDNADGQLARLTGRGSRQGRIIDSCVDHLIFVSIYVHLALRCLVAGASPAIFLLALAAGLSHALQGGAADYFRNAYLYFANGRASAHLDSATVLRSEFSRLTWSRDAWKKFLLALYLNFTRQQEMIAPELPKLRRAVDQVFPDEIPAWFKARYRGLANPMFKWWGLLMTNTRMLILFLLLFLGRPAAYFWIELTVLNGLLVWLLLRQSKMFGSLLAAATTTSFEPATVGS